MIRGECHGSGARDAVSILIQRVAELQTQVTEAEEKLKRLYQMVEDGLGEATALSLADGPLAARSS